MKNDLLKKGENLVPLVFMGYIDKPIATIKFFKSPYYMGD